MLTNTTTISVILQNLSLNNLVEGKNLNKTDWDSHKAFLFPVNDQRQPPGSIPIVHTVQAACNGSQGYLTSKVPTSGII